MSAATTARWCDRSCEQWALRVTNSREVVLMTRMADNDGLGKEGDPAPWRDIATFISYFEARKVWKRLAADSGSPGADR